MKKINYRHFIAIGITVAFVLAAIFLYDRSYFRVAESFRDLWTSMEYYGSTLFFEENLPTATVIAKSGLGFGDIFPVTFEAFKTRLSLFGRNLVSGDNMYAFLVYSSHTMLIIYMIAAFAVCLFFLIKTLFGLQLRSVNNQAGEESKALKIYKRVERRVSAVIGWVKNCFTFFAENRYISIWLLLWLFNLNVITIIVEAFAYLFYFIASIDFVNLYIQLYKLVCDLFLMLNGLPAWLWVIVVCVLLNKYRISKGYDNLEHMEAEDTGFARSLGIATMITAPMNGNKTKLTTDLAITFSKIYKYDARESMRKCEREFPNFPFSVYVRLLTQYFNNHTLYSFATIERFVHNRKIHFCRAINQKRGKVSPSSYLFGYDYLKYGVGYNNGLYITDIFTVLETYAKNFFVYSLSDSFIVSNYAIREDGVLDDMGNLPLWNFDYVHRKPEELDDISYYSKILDFDILRKGKTVVDNNPLSDTFEFGVVTITEFDKDRGNQLDTKGLKRDSAEANQLNDLFNYSPKMGRHPATVDFTPYIRYLFDLQRAMKTEADVREICDCILAIVSSDKRKMAMPLFFFEEFIYGIIADKFAAFLDEYDYYRADSTLSGYLITKIAGGFINRYERLYNIFGYDVLNIDVQNGKMDSPPNMHDYYILYKKAHADRYATDCYGWFFRDAALKKNKGLVDYPSYGGSKATEAEMDKQNSYFIRALQHVAKEEPAPRKLKLKKADTDGIESEEPD